MKLSHQAFALLLLCAPLSAQLDEKAAVAQYKSETKALLKDFKADSTPLKQAAVDAIEAFEDDLSAGGDAFAAADTLAGALHAYHGDMRTLLLELALASDASWQQALSDFAGGAALDGIYPEGLVSGDGGAVDDLRTAVDKHLFKLAASLNKRLDKAEKAADKEGFGLLAWSGPPPGLNASAASESLNVSAFPELTADVLLSLSALDSAADGQLWIGGTSNSTKLPVAVSVTQGLAQLDSGGIPVSLQQTWQLHLDGSGAGLAEGNVIVLVDVDNTGAIAAKPFAIR